MRRIRQLCCGAAVLLAACSGGSGPPLVTAIAASFTPSASGAAADFVRITSGASAGDRVTLNVTVGGPSTSTDIYAFSFDLLFGSAALVQYEAGSAVVGGALSVGGCAGMEALATQNGDRVIVGVTKLGACAGNAIPSGEQLVVSLTFRVAAAGTTSVLIVGSPGNPQNPAPTPSAFDSTGSVIGSISFDLAAATIRGM